MVWKTFTFTWHQKVDWVTNSIPSPGSKLLQVAEEFLQLLVESRICVQERKESRKQGSKEAGKEGRKEGKTDQSLYD